jgi:ribonuclease J
VSIDFKKHKNDLVFLPLGGAKEIGMNLNLYQYKGKWLIVDFGAGFADDCPGVNMIVPNIEFLEDKKKDILGIVLTHIHEDHLGAIQYLWPELECPIYATRFTKNFLKARLADTSFAKHVKIHELKEKERFDLGPFNIELVEITHSTPEMQALMIRTDLGNIFHTGDWKFDPNPLIGEPTDLHKLKKIGDEGVLALVGDSTNVFNEEHSGSEGDLRDNLVEIIASCKKMVVVTTFASNIARFDTIIRAAQKSGRRIALAGRSLWRVLDAAQASGYLEDIPEFVNEDNIKDIPRNKLLVISTGCQGEQFAAATKMANQSHPFIRLSKDDTVIFSSKIIPGNEKKIFKVFNKLIGMGVEVLTERDHFVHVSGHPSRVELKQMFEMIRPKIAIPVHGELMHIHEHAKLALSSGVKQAIEIQNGMAVKIAPELETLGLVENGYLAVDGNTLIDVNSYVLKIRRKIQDEGIVFAVVILSKDNRLLLPPIVKAPGVLDERDDKDIIQEIEAEIEYVIEQHAGSKVKHNNATIETIENIVRQACRRVLKEQIGKSPVLNIKVERI